MAQAAVHIQHGAYRPHNQFILTYNGGLLGALELSGADPDGMSEADRQTLTLVLRNLLNKLPDNVILSEYYIHFDQQNVSLAERSHPIIKQIREYRQRHLNQLNLSGSRCVLFLELYSPSDVFSRFKYFCTQLLRCLHDRGARNYIKTALLYGQANSHSQTALAKLTTTLSALLTEISTYCSGLFDVRHLNKNEIYRYIKFFATCDVDYLQSDLICPNQIDTDLVDGEITPVNIQGMELLKIVNHINTFLRILSVKQFNFDRFSPGLFAGQRQAAVRCPGNYILCTRYKAISEVQKTLLFMGKENELERQSVSLTDYLTGLDSDYMQTMQIFKPSLIRRFQELDEAQALLDRWGLVSTYAVVFDTDLKRLEENSLTIKNALQLAGMSLLYETIAATEVFFDLQPANDHRSRFFRDIILNTSQFATLSLVYRAAQGNNKVEDLNNEEAQYIFVSSDNTPFYFAPFIGGCGVTIGVGPIRTGKSFLRVALAMHWLKYGGIYRAIDIDPGSEPVAEAFGSEGGIFRVNEGQSAGFNLFVSAQAVDDHAFVSHLSNLIMLMIASNPSTEMQSLSMDEQLQLDRAISASLKLPKEYQRLQTVVQHCDKPLMQKMSRFVGDGQYAGLFDAEKDAIGMFAKRVGVFNLTAIKDDPIAKRLAMSEIAFRIFRLFENPDYRTSPKWLDLDEAHHLLENPYITQELIAKRIRTWGKWLGGIGMWTQSGVEFEAVQDWGAIRSAVSTFIFTADPSVDRDTYKRIFQLKDGAIDAIKTLMPKREIYIVQPALNISKRCIIDVEAEQYVLSTSKPTEATTRQKNIDTYGFDEGIKRTIQDLELRSVEPSEELASTPAFRPVIPKKSRIKDAALD